MDNYEELLQAVEETLRGYSTYIVQDILPVVMDELDSKFTERGIHKLLED